MRDLCSWLELIWRYMSRVICVTDGCGGEKGECCVATELAGAGYRIL